jgi:hypothetical protein
MVVLAKILHIVNSFDPACDVVRCVDELDRFSKHTHELVVKETHPMNDQYKYKTAGLVNVDSLLVKDLAEWADALIYHFVGVERGWHINTDKPVAFRNANIYYDKVKDKFWSVDYYNAADLRHYKLLASSHIGAQDFLPDCRFLPDLIPIDKPLYTPSNKSKRPCVSYIKHADTFSKASFSGVDHLNLNKTPHHEVLHQRRKFATLVIDNICDGHYGLAGLESLALGLPTIVFNHSVTEQKLIEIGNGEPSPFISVNGTAFAAIDAAQCAIDQPQFLADVGGNSRRWMEMYHNSGVLIDRYWDRFFDELLGLTNNKF